jgi:hypothetical protein
MPSSQPTHDDPNGGMHFKTYMDELANELDRMEADGNVPAGMGAALRDDAWAEDNGRPKTRLAQIAPHLREWARLADHEFVEGRNNGGKEYGDQVIAMRPADWETVE